MAPWLPSPLKTFAFSSSEELSDLSTLPAMAVCWSSWFFTEDCLRGGAGWSALGSPARDWSRVLFWLEAVVAMESSEGPVGAKSGFVVS